MEPTTNIMDVRPADQTPVQQSQQPEILQGQSSYFTPRVLPDFVFPTATESRTTGLSDNAQSNYSTSAQKGKSTLLKSKSSTSSNNFYVDRNSNITRVPTVALDSTSIEARLSAVSDLFLNSGRYSETAADGIRKYTISLHSSESTAHGSLSDPSKIPTFKGFSIKSQLKKWKSDNSLGSNNISVSWSQSPSRKNVTRLRIPAPLTHPSRLAQSHSTSALPNGSAFAHLEKGKQPQLIQNQQLSTNSIELSPIPSIENDTKPNLSIDTTPTGKPGKVTLTMASPEKALILSPRTRRVQLAPTEDGDVSDIVDAELAPPHPSEPTSSRIEIAQPGNNSRTTYVNFNQDNQVDIRIAGLDFGTSPSTSSTASGMATTTGPWESSPSLYHDVASNHRNADANSDNSEDVENIEDDEDEFENAMEDMEGDEDHEIDRSNDGVGIINIRFGGNAINTSMVRSIVVISARLSSTRQMPHILSSRQQSFSSPVDEIQHQHMIHRRLSQQYKVMFHSPTSASSLDIEPITETTSTRDPMAFALNQPHILQCILENYYETTQRQLPGELWSVRTIRTVAGPKPNTPLLVNKLWFGLSKSIVYKDMNCVYRPERLFSKMLVQNGESVQKIFIDTFTCKDFDRVFNQLKKLPNLREVHIVARKIKPSKSTKFVNFLNRLTAHFSPSKTVDESLNNPLGSQSVSQRERSTSRHRERSNIRPQAPTTVEEIETTAEQDMDNLLQQLQDEEKRTSRGRQMETPESKERRRANRRRHRSSQRRRRANARREIKQQDEENARLVTSKIDEYDTNELELLIDQEDASNTSKGNNFTISLDSNLSFSLFRALYRWQLAQPRTRTARTMFPRPVDKNSFIPCIKNFVINNYNEHAYWSQPLEMGILVFPGLKSLTVRGSEFEEEGGDDIATSIMNDIVRDFMMAEKIGINVSYLKRIESQFSTLTHLELHDCIISNLTFLDIIIFNQGRSTTPVENENPVALQARLARELGINLNGDDEEDNDRAINEVRGRAGRRNDTIFNSLSHIDGPLSQLQTVVISQVSVLESIDSNDFYETSAKILTKNIEKLLNILEPEQLKTVLDNIAKTKETEAEAKSKKAVEESAASSPDATEHENDDESPLREQPVTGAAFKLPPIFATQVLTGSPIKTLVVSKSPGNFWKRLVQVLTLSGYYRTLCEMAVEKDPELEYASESGVTFDPYIPYGEQGSRFRRMTTVKLDRRSWTTWNQDSITDEFITMHFPQRKSSANLSAAKRNNNQDLVGIVPVSAFKSTNDLDLLDDDFEASSPSDIPRDHPMKLPAREDFETITIRPTIAPKTVGPSVTVSFFS